MRNGGRASGVSSARAGERHQEVGTLETVARRSSEARKRIGAWREELARQTREHPVRSLAVALGVGFVLGGGLFSRVTARIVGTGLRVGLRMAVMPLVTQSLVALGDGLLTPRAPVDVGADRPIDPRSEINKRRRTHEAQ
jgi:hypothetical protein